MPVTFDDCEVMRESDDAILVLIPDIDDDPIWIPRSQVHPYSDIRESGDTGDLVVTTWFAEQRSWI